MSRKLTAEDVADIRASSETTAAVAARHGISRNMAHMIRSGRCWPEPDDYEPTAEEVETTVQQQSQHLPLWWHKESREDRGDEEPPPLAVIRGRSLSLARE